jgi:hypothetical protein
MAFISLLSLFWEGIKPSSWIQYQAYLVYQTSIERIGSNLHIWLSGISGYPKNKVWYIGLFVIGVMRLFLTSPAKSEIMDT